MPGKIFSNRIFSAVRKFAKADQGNIAVMFAFAALPILASVGAAIDYSRVNKARTSLQAALDSAALMVSKDLTNGTISESDIDATAISVPFTPTRPERFLRATSTPPTRQKIAAGYRPS